LNSSRISPIDGSGYFFKSLFLLRISIYNNKNEPSSRKQVRVGKFLKICDNKLMSM
jgi:hypothetical protein